MQFKSFSIKHIHYERLETESHNAEHAEVREVEGDENHALRPCTPVEGCNFKDAPQPGVSPIFWETQPENAEAKDGEDGSPGSENAR